MLPLGSFLDKYSSHIQEALLNQLQLKSLEAYYWEVLGGLSRTGQRWRNSVCRGVLLVTKPADSRASMGLIRNNTSAVLGGCRMDTPGLPRPAPALHCSSAGMQCVERREARRCTKVLAPGHSPDGLAVAPCSRAVGGAVNMEDELPRRSRPTLAPRPSHSSARVGAAASEV